MGTKDDTQPIELAAGRPRALRRREVTREVNETPDPDRPEPDAPATKADRTGSDYVRGLVDTVLTTAKKPHPSEADMRKLNAEVTALAMLAEKGLALLGGSGGSGRGGMLVTVLVAAGVALGVPNLAGTNDALAEAIAGRIDAQDTRLEQTDKRIGDLEESMETFRYALGKLIEYQIQDNYNGCTRDETQIRALNWIAGQLPRENEDGEKYEPTSVKCEQNPLLNEDLTDLLNYARRVDNAR